MQKVNICWLRRDLRLNDNAALYHALKSSNPVIPVFIFDTNILSKLDNKADKRVQFIYTAIHELQASLIKLGTSLLVYHCTPAEAFKQLLSTFTIEQVFTNQDYEPYALDRDKSIEKILNEKGVSFGSFKDQVIFEKSEVVKDDGKPYTVFTPYSRKWKSLLGDSQLAAYPTEKYYNNFYRHAPLPILSLAEMGFRATTIFFPGKDLNKQIILKYQDQRNYPAIAGTSKLGVHLRFGTISIREIARKANSLSDTFMNELIWRDFYQMILWHFPQVAKGSAFKPAYDTIEWRRDEGEFERWCNGETGYPLVDAGMRELNATGFMHNRVRMVVASFLAKHLLLDWRLGEAYFAEKLLDYDLASNNGGWQWAAGSGCDAAPYFRIFNPTLQTKKFDPQMDYIKKWVPEYQEFNYTAQIVEHEIARKRCLAVYAKALKK